jgi:hypothetical protein
MIRANEPLTNKPAIQPEYRRMPLMMVDLQPALPQICEGKLRALGVTIAVRVGSPPDTCEARRACPRAADRLDAG